MWVRRRKNRETFKTHNWDYPVWWIKREKNEENEDSKILIRKQQVYQSMYNRGSRRREKEKRTVKYIWRCNSQNFPKSDERHEHTHRSCLTNTKNKVKETAPKRIIIEPPKTKKNPKGSKRNNSSHTKRSLIRITADFSSETTKTRDNGMK